ncbi:hypothetical protein OBBRIDRAFT_721771, partial [Obba rivulosa]
MTGGPNATVVPLISSNVPQAGEFTRSERADIPLAPDPTPLVDFQARNLSDTPEYVEVPLPSFPSPRIRSASAASPTPGDPNEIPDLERELRRRFALSDDTPINLNVIPDPQPGEKPGQSYPTLIKLAIYGSPHKRLTLQGIFEALENRFEWFRNNRHDKAWQNSIRHNLSLNKVFVKVEKPITEPGKGMYWTVDYSQGEGNKRPRKR